MASSLTNGIKSSNITLFSRYEDMYCSDEWSDFIKYHSITDLNKLTKVKKEFKAIWDERHKYWEKVNENSVHE